MNGSGGGGGRESVANELVAPSPPSPSPLLVPPSPSLVAEKMLPKLLRLLKVPDGSGRLRDCGDGDRDWRG